MSHSPAASSSSSSSSFQLKERPLVNEEEEEYEDQDEEEEGDAEEEEDEEPILKYQRFQGPGIQDILKQYSITAITAHEKMMVRTLIYVSMISAFCVIIFNLFPLPYSPQVILFLLFWLDGGYR